MIRKQFVSAKKYSNSSTVAALKQAINGFSNKKLCSELEGCENIQLDSRRRKFFWAQLRKRVSIFTKPSIIYVPRYITFKKEIMLSKFWDYYLRWKNLTSHILLSLGMFTIRSYLVFFCCLKEITRSIERQRRRRKLAIFSRNLWINEISRGK